MIYFYYGEDSFRAKQTIDLLKNKFVELYDPGGHNIEYIDPDEFSLERFNTTVRSSGFLAVKKFIIIKNIFSVRKFVDIQDSLIEFLDTQKNNKEENYLVFWHEGMPRKNIKLFKYLTKKCSRKCVNNFEPLKKSKLAKWIQGQVAKNNKKIEPGATDLLMSFIGDNTWHLYHEIQKLCHSVTEDKITALNVEKITTAKSTEEIFPFLDALGEKNKPRALALLEKNLQTETDHLYLLAMMIRQFRLIVKAREISKKTRNSFSISQQLGLPPFITKKIIFQSSKYNDRDLIRTYEDLITIDRLIKRSPEKVRAAMTLFVTKL